MSLELVSGSNSQGGSVMLTFPATAAGRRRARRYARALRAIFGWADVSAYASI